MPLLLYSAGTLLAYQINELYYRRHWVYCTPNFDDSHRPRLAPAPPASSCPRDIYADLARDVRTADRHSAKIAQNRVGLIKGASAQRGQGRITADQEAEVIAIVNSSELQDFRPVLYLIPYEGVRAKARLVPLNQRANSFSEEYIIDELLEHEFQVIQFSE